MLCTKCKTNTACFFYTQNINGVESTAALCKSCANSIGISSNIISPLFSSVFSNHESTHKKHINEQKKCSLCALTFNDILSMGKVGCTECYNSFKNELNETIRSIHGTSMHIGLSPTESTENPENKENLSEEEILNKRLKESILNENYEEAAVLRDKIKALKGDSHV